MPATASTVPIGLIGLAVMGQNLALNIEEKGFPIAVFNRTTSRMDDFVAANPGKRLLPCRTIEELVASLEKPRRVIVMVQAGDPVDQQMALLRPHLEAGDVFIDAGNSWFQDTQRREKEFAAAGLRYLGMGVSGGEEGARHGPSIMPGGDRSAYELIAPVLTRIAAQVDDGPCVTYVGPDGAGHFVKMVHNGIEYGDMQLICEAYDLLRHVAGCSAEELAAIFAAWNGGELQSYLIEITADILGQHDEETGRPMVDVILDTAGQKGTGKLTAQYSLELAAPVPTIDAAVTARLLSALKSERVAASRVLAGPALAAPADRDAFVEQVRAALYAAKVCSYAQGMAMIRLGSEANAWDLDLAEIARIWKGGCIIRARLLDRISQAYRRDRKLPNLLVDASFREELAARQPAWRATVHAAVTNGIACAAMAASLAYFDSYRRERLPANLLQAQRDYFGAHTFQRVDREGAFHREWL